MVEKHQIVWTVRSQQNMRQLYNYIRRDSLQNAEKVSTDSTKAIEKAASNPERYNPYKYKKDNDGSFRAFEKHRYRISYRFNNNVMRILRIRHTGKEPHFY